MKELLLAPGYLWMFEVDRTLELGSEDRHLSSSGAVITPEVASSSIVSKCYASKDQGNTYCEVSYYQQ